MEKNNAFKKGILTGFGFPGIGMSAAMFGFGVFAGEGGLDLYLCLGSLLILWSMPGMVIFVSLFSNTLLILGRDILHKKTSKKEKAIASQNSCDKKNSGFS